MCVYIQVQRGLERDLGVVYDYVMLINSIINFFSTYVYIVCNIKFILFFSLKTKNKGKTYK